MALFDFFKKKKRDLTKKEKQQQEVSEHKEQLKEKLQKEAPAPKTLRQDRPLAGYQGRDVLKEPHITEKAVRTAENNEYVFKVYPKAGKYDVKKAVEALYGVKVDGVRMIRIPRKKKRLGRFEGWRKSYKKAIVKVAKGQHIEILPK